MADVEHVERLKGNVSDWNRWRSETPPNEVDLTGADLARLDLTGANLQGASLFGARLSGTRLNGADLRRANLAGTDLRGANLSESNLSNATLSAADLSVADLTRADLTWALLRGTCFQDTRFDQVRLGNTSFVNVDLSETELTTCVHVAPSSVDQMTLANFRVLPIRFLQGCGLADWHIEAARLFNRKLSSPQIADIVYKVHELRSRSPIILTNLFISYSHEDTEFVDYLGRALDERRIRYWRDIRDSFAGPLENVVVRAMQDNPTVLLVLSQHSTSSDWVEFEVVKARELEKELDRHVLCPIALDDSWRSSKWSGVLRNQVVKYNILPFHDWRNSEAFDNGLRRLLGGLHAHYVVDKSG
jgi:hypothetical protein